MAGTCQGSGYKDGAGSPTELTDKGPGQCVKDGRGRTEGCRRALAVSEPVGAWPSWLVEVRQSGGRKGPEAFRGEEATGWIGDRSEVQKRGWLYPLPKSFLSSRYADRENLFTANEQASGCEAVSAQVLG